MKKIIILFVIVIFATSCKKYFCDYIYSPDGKKCVTFVQFHKISEPENAGVYLVYGKYSKIYNKAPTSNYLFFKYSDYPFYYKWSDNKFIIRFPGCDIIENKLITDSIDFKINFTKEERIKYNGKTNRDFYENVKHDFISKTTSELTQNW